MPCAPLAASGQVHLKIRTLSGEVEPIFNVLVDTGAVVSLVKPGLLPPESLTASQRPVKLQVANGEYMVGGTNEAEIALQFVNHPELSSMDLGKEILLKGKFYEAQMDWDMMARGKRQAAEYPTLSHPWLSHPKERTKGDTPYSRLVYVSILNRP